jgi:SOS-response transcriptional repressor LexA
MCSSLATGERMERTPDDKRQILRDFIKEQGLKIARWAKDSAVDKNSIYNFLNGHSQALDLRTYAKLARSAAVPLHRLTGDMPEPTSPVPIWVVGYVQAGMFREAVEWDRSRWYEVDVPVPERFRRVAKALEIRGNSMNLEYPDGSVAIWVDILDSRPARHGDHVVVYAHRPDGKVEATIKELRIDRTTRWLWPRSDDPTHQTPMNIDDPPEGISVVEVKGLVIGGYRPRVV